MLGMISYCFQTSDICNQEGMLKTKYSIFQNIQYTLLQHSIVLVSWQG